MPSKVEAATLQSAGDGHIAPCDLLHPAPARPSERTLADFGDLGRWEYTGGEVAGRVTLLANGDALLAVEAVSSSGAFKYFAEPHAALAVTDGEGRVIASAAVNGLVMRMSLSGLDHKRDKSYQPVKAAGFCPARYAFFLFKYCAWQQTFERTVGNHNGCYQTDLRRSYDEFANALPRALDGLAVQPGETFELLGWRGIRLPR